ncbi:hypothetical protein [Myroides guanonis]|uniref:DNA replication protein DnaC n=1 Tax=Myroides guanonis TaxID=1150112 RepID=A0A1I3L2N6_9FLAO|nr:hypothetical protein [Myroides guanonis]SFI78695.1 hypothetical protein SAMN04487893_101143 [Myroides guanonis]
MKNNSKISFEQTYVIDEKAKTYYLPRCYQYLEQKGKELYGPAFKINSEQISSIQKILTYAIQDENSSNKLGMSLKKGLFINGPEGSGKSAIMHLLKPFFGKRFSFESKSCKTISFEYARKGFEALHPYLHQSGKYTRPRIYCFDDFGTESIQKHFGNECDVMKEIMCVQYEEFIEKGHISHIVSELTPSEIEKKYGTKMRNQLRTMYNLINF